VPVVSGSQKTVGFLLTDLLLHLFLVAQQLPKPVDIPWIRLLRGHLKQLGQQKVIEQFLMEDTPLVKRFLLMEETVQQVLVVIGEIK